MSLASMPNCSTMARIRKYTTEPKDGGGKTDAKLREAAGQQTAEHLTDNNGGKTDNDGTGAHTNVGILLALADERAGKADEGVGSMRAIILVELVLTPRARIMYARCCRWRAAPSRSRCQRTNTGWQR